MTRQSLRDAMIAYLPAALRAGKGGDWRSALPAELVARLADDGSALAEWRGLLLQARTLTSLARPTAPEDLEGRVVASLNTGFQQDRVVDQLVGLERQAVPRELDARVRRLVEQPFPFPAISAPAVLDRLVQEEVSDPGRSAVRRLRARLGRRRAPRVLGRRLEALARKHGIGGQGSNDRRRAGRLLPVFALMVAAGLAWGVFRDKRGLQVHAGSALENLSFAIEPMTIRDADAFTVAILNAHSGGSIDGGVR